MSSATPPNPYFSGINFNPSFFTVISTYLTEAIANSKYLRLIGGTLSGFLGIKRTPRVELDVNGKAVIKGTAVPTNPAQGEFGSDGTKLILVEGTVSETPIAIGSSSDGMWIGTNSITGISFYTGLSHRMRLKNNGYVGIGTTDPKSLLTVNSYPAITNAFDFSVTPTTITNTTPTSTTVLNDPLPSLFLCREGTVGQAYASRSTFSLCRWENNANNSRTRLDIGLSHALFDNVNIMSLRSDGAVSIGTTTPQSTNTKLTISGSSSGYSQPLVQITQTNPVWNGNYALQVDGYTLLGGFRINANDGGNSIYQTLANKDIGIAQFPTAGNTGNIATTTFGSGAIKFFTNGNNERVRIDSSGYFYTNSYGYFGALDNSGMRLDKTGIFLSSANTAPLNIYHQNTSQSVRLGFFGGNNIILTINNTYAEFSQPALATKIGIGTTSIPSSILQVGDGGRLRISNGTTDSTLIGSKEVADTNNTRLIVYGYQHASRAGCMEYVATTGTGAHTFWLNNSTAVADIDYTDFTVFNSITTIGANYYTDGEYISYSTKTNVGGTVKSGYFISNEYFFNSFINIAVSHNSTFYTYWHGHYGTNNTPAVMYVSSISNYSMTFESFDEQTTLKSWIYVVPTVSFNSATKLRVKFYG